MHTEQSSPVHSGSGGAAGTHPRGRPPGRGIEPKAASSPFRNTEHAAANHRRGASAPRAAPARARGFAAARARDTTVASTIAAHMLEAAEADLEFKDGKFTVAGTDKEKSFGEIALSAYVPHNFPHDRLEPGLEETAFDDPLNFTYPSGTHIAEVEIDPATGVVELVDWACCDDFGNLINPMIVEGQVHGGIAQGVGQALLENAHYDESCSSTLASTFSNGAKDPNTGVVSNNVIGVLKF